MRNSFSRPVLGLQDTHSEQESYRALRAWCADPNSLDVMRGGVPTSFEPFHAAQEIVPIQSLGHALLNNHSSQNNTQCSDGIRMELVVESVLQRIQHAAEGEAKLRGPNDPIDFQMVKAQPAAPEQFDGNVPVEGALSGARE
jgi:hypothetical protein